MGMGVRQGPQEPLSLILTGLDRSAQAAWLMREPLSLGLTEATEDSPASGLSLTGH